MAPSKCLQACLFSVAALVFTLAAGNENVARAAQIDPITTTAATLTPLAYQDEPNEVTYVDFLAKVNAQHHRTERYQTANQYLVLRRAETFRFNVMLSRPYNELVDRLRLEFNFGNHPSREDGSQIYVPLVSTGRRVNMSQPIELARLKWDARITSFDSRLIQIEVNMPPSMPVGTWRLKISTKVASGDNLRTFTIRDTFHVLFNAWNELDDAFMPDESWRQEYLNEEVGKIYVGSYASPQGRRWNYGQFDPAVLPTTLFLLDRTRLSVPERADIVKTARAVSAIVNSNDEGGLLVGNWSGNYLDGLSPWQWTGSAMIFKKFIQNGYRPVKFGQCWVFGGSTTATLRTLGIPARTISNFNSAHDTDSSLTVDKFYENNGRTEVSEVNGDSVWNFHVWSDAWMRRRDLPTGYDGWQAIDATPQERSQETYQLGPAPLEAIKRGKTGWAYDVGFVFSEVNADIVHWRPTSGGPASGLRWQKYRIQAGHMGRKILTKMVGRLDLRTRTQTSDAEDIVGQYKFSPGTPEAKQAYDEAVKSFGVQPLFN